MNEGTQIMKRTWKVLAAASVMMLMGCSYRAHQTPAYYPSGGYYPMPAASGCASCNTGTGYVVAPRYTPPFAAPPPPRSLESAPPATYSALPPMLLKPEPATQNSPSFQARVMPPKIDESRSGGETVDTAKKPEENRPSIANTSNAMDLPVTIPEFNVVSEFVATGHKPFPEGYDWLKQNQYSTLLFIRGMGAGDEAAFRTEAEKRGMKLVVLEVTPQSLSRETVVRFQQQLQSATSSQKLFVLDETGKASGTLWYLHFRLNENLPDSIARTRAVRLGMPDQPQGEDNALWQAAVQVMAK